MCSSQLSLSLISRIYIPMDSNLTKVCPQCNSRAVCKCGYAFPSKRKAQSGNAMKRRRVHKVSVRASETSRKTLCRQEMIEYVELAREPLRHPQPLVNVHATITFSATLSMSICLSLLARGLGFSHSPSLHLLND